VKKTIIYIAGYGRSGSTLLDVILGSHPQIIGTGELANIFDCMDDPASTCSCGKNVHDCSFWGDVTTYLQSDKQAGQKHRDGVIQKSCEDWTNGSLLFNDRKKRYDGYRTLMTGLFDYIFKISGKEFVVDSSKNAYTSSWRPLALKKICGYDVKLIHLIRDGKGVMTSKMRGDNTDMRKGIYRKKPFAALEGLFGWIFANLVVIITRILLPPKAYYLMKYEDMVREPEEELTRVGSFLGLDFKETIHSIRRMKPIPVGHLISGNRLAYNNSTILIDKDSVRKASLPLHLSILYYFLGWPIIAYTWLHNFTRTPYRS
jgi:hypothetical protein